MNNKRLSSIILVFCGLVLVMIIAYYTVCVPSTFCFFVDRWVSSPDYSPDGQRVAFRCHYPTLSQAIEDVFRDFAQGSFLFQWGYISQATEICTVYTDGSHLVRLTDNQATDGLPAWSPDGRLIAYISDSPSIPDSRMKQAVRIVRGDGSQSEMISGSLDVIWDKPVWSPEGNKISFAAGTPLKHNPGINLYLADLESKNVRELTDLPGDELGARWSPNGTRLAFIWYPEGYGGACPMCSEEAAIQIINAKGGNDTVVENFANIGGLTWSPDGTRLAFWGSRSADCPNNDCTEVYIIDLLNGSMECLTEHYELAVIGQTTWSPAEEKIAFTARTSTGYAIYTIAPDGKALARITLPIARADRDLTWAPDGKSIAFVRGVEGEKWKIWFVETKDGDLSKFEIP